MSLSVFFSLNLPLVSLPVSVSCLSSLSLALSLSVCLSLPLSVLSLSLSLPLPLPPSPPLSLVFSLTQAFRFRSGAEPRGGGEAYPQQARGGLALVLLSLRRGRGTEPLPPTNEGSAPHHLPQALRLWPAVGAGGNEGNDGNRENREGETRVYCGEIFKIYLQMLSNISLRTCEDRFHFFARTLFLFVFPFVGTSR